MEVIEGTLRWKKEMGREERLYGNREERNLWRLGEVRDDLRSDNFCVEKMVHSCIGHIKPLPLLVVQKSEMNEQF